MKKSQGLSRTSRYLGMALLTLRFFQLAWRIAKGDLDRIVASHEVGDELEEALACEEELQQAAKGLVK